MSAVLSLVPKPEGATLRDAWLDFKLARQAVGVSPATLEFYEYTAGKFVGWLIEEAGLTAPAELTSRQVRQYLIAQRERGLQEGAVHGHARAIRALLNFWRQEGWVPKDAQIEVEMPRLPRKRHPAVTAEDAKLLLVACETPREKAVVLLLLDSGLRRGEACGLNWGDVNLKTGMVVVREGKGRKDRAVVIGPTTRRALLRYRRRVPHEDADPVLRSERAGEGNGRLTGSGLRGMLVRVGKRAGVQVSPHMFRRGFATLSLRHGMSPLHLQGLLGHTSLEMVRRYAQLVDDDLAAAHEAHSPVERWLK